MVRTMLVASFILIELTFNKKVSFTFAFMEFHLKLFQYNLHIMFKVT